MPRPKKTKANTRNSKFVVAAFFLVALLVTVYAIWPRRDKSDFPKTYVEPSSGTNSDAAVFTQYGGSASCKDCHEEAYKNWAHSHHGLAERLVNFELDKSAFDPAQTIFHGSQTSAVRVVNGKFEFVAENVAGEQTIFPVDRVIGVNPLRQFLIPTEGGRWQSTELAFDPRHTNWFDVFGDEDRKPGEWGHWTGRGMTWNSMCATCHNTQLRKNYDEKSDSYFTTMAEMGVGCETCHGPMKAHNEWQAKNPNRSGDPTIRPLVREELFYACGACHARRSELTKDFPPGANFFDHFQLAIPDETDIFYPDGQVRDEDYEFTAFLGSKMYAAGVRCNDCHEPHSAKTRISGNLLCMTCHGALNNNAPFIDLLTHSRHKVGESGDNCTDCHMPQTTYMQRHGRHDHGFTVPDPRLTIELGIPNACNRCHTNQTPQWSLDAIVKWYGPRTNEMVRTRATTVAQARAGNPAAAPALVKMLRDESIPLWRAVAANLLKRWSHQPEVTSALLSATHDTNELVRAMAVRGLEPLARSGNQAVDAALSARLKDPIRSVRVEAAWALHHTIDTNSLAGRNLLESLRHNIDQPGGALQMGVFQMDRGNLNEALSYFERAVKWDPNSAPLHHALAVALSTQGKSAEAVASLKTAVRLAPNDAEYRYKLGLALNETGNLREARDALAEAVRLDPQYARAWYNLGLASSALNEPEVALEQLLRAETLDSTSPQIPYARATILARLGQYQEARSAARRALELQPDLVQAQQLLQSLQQ